MERIYLDFNATTPVHPTVAKAMRPYLEEYFGNPSSQHWFGTQSKLGIEKARKQIASLLNCNPDEIIFTSGGTESNNTALKGLAYANKHKGNHIITSSIEHPAVLEVCKYLERSGFIVSYLPVDKFGIVQLEDVRNAITSNTILISIMHANNEVGTIQPIKEIAELAGSHNVLMHTDAAQSVGKLAINVDELGIDALSLAGHKIYAPKGIGALYLKRGIKIEKLMHGADHERNLRAGTENVLEIIGLGEACEFAERNIESHIQHMKELRDELFNQLKSKIKNIYLLGHPELRLPNTVNIGFKGIEANTILSELESIAASAGAACHADKVDVSHVLTAMDVPEEIAMGAIRFSTGVTNTKEEINIAVGRILNTINKLQHNNSDEKHLTSYTGSQVKLTHFTHGLGCACKLRPEILEMVLKKFPIIPDKNIIVDLQTNDDAVVYKINEKQAILGTVDFFTPIVDDPYSFGAIAASNALSDIYAMGGEPLFAMNIVGFPTNRLPIEVLESILEGAMDKAKEAGIGILGGHTIEDTEPKFGMVITGLIHPDKILRNSGAIPGDVLILTKPIGTGILSTAMKKGILSDNTLKTLTQSMASLNKMAADLAKKHPVNACTDITGFGLLGHLLEMTQASKVQARIQVERVPLLPDSYDFAINGVIPGGTKSNLKYVSPSLDWDDNVTETDRLLLADAQTSGGLLFSIPEKSSEAFLNSLLSNGLEYSRVIGRIEAIEKKHIFLSRN